jgi:hypothetical protein
LKESQEFKELFYEQFLGSELTKIGEDLLGDIARGDKKSEELNREALILRKKFESHLSLIEDEGASATNYLIEYEQAKKTQEELDADQQ